MKIERKVHGQGPPDFERFTQQLRMSLFHARCLLSEEACGSELADEHLLLGILRTAPSAIMRFAKSATTADELSKRLRSAISRNGDRQPEGAEIPLSDALRNTWKRAVLQADAFGHRAISPEHFVLTIVEDDSSPAGRLLRKFVLTPAEIRGVLRNG